LSLRALRARLGVAGVVVAAAAGAVAIPQIASAVATPQTASTSLTFGSRGGGVAHGTRVDVRALPRSRAPLGQHTPKPFFTRDPKGLAAEKASGKGTIPNRTISAPTRSTVRQGGNSAGSFAGPFFGVSHDSQLGFEGDIEPPDTQLAAGPSSVIEFVNSAFLIMDRSGGVQAFGSIEQFFNFVVTGQPGERGTDPRVYYDSSSGRFFATELGFSLSGGRPASGTVLVAVSSDSNPLDPWSIIPTYKKTNALCDQPVLGVSGDKVGFACNEFNSTGAFTADFIYVLNKSQLLAGSLTPAFNVFASASAFSVTPALTLNPNGPLQNTLFATYNREFFGVAQIGVVAVTGTPGVSTVGAFESDLAMRPTTAPPPAAQLGDAGGARKIETNDYRFLNAVWQGGRLWTGGNEGCVVSSLTVSCLKLVQVDTSGWNPGVSGAPTVGPDFDAAATGGFHLYYPALTVNPGGDLYTVFSESSATFPVSVGAFDISQCGANTGLLQPFFFIQGVDTYQDTHTTRWGDYSGAAIDPNDPNKLWLTGEYTAGQTSNRQWGTGTVQVPASTQVDGGRPYTGGHDAVGVTGGATDWYFAEGYTGLNFDEYLTVQNPGAAQTLCVDYLLEGGSVVSRSYNLPGSSRTTLRVNDEVGPNLNVSMHLHAGSPIIAERPMYFLYNGSVAGVTGGHDVMGATSPRSTFYFAEGYTGAGFDEYLTMMNVDPILTSNVNVTYFFSSGTSKLVPHSVGPHSRLTVLVNSAMEAGPNQNVSTLVQVASGPSIVAERPMYFNYQGKWTGGHVVIGAGTPSTHLDLAEGFVSSTFDEWLTILNPGAALANVTITYNLSGGGTVVKTMTVGANSRGTRLVNADFSAATSQSVHVDSDQPSVVERPMYFDYFGNVQNVTGGHDAVAVDSSTLGTSYSFAEGYVASNFDEYLTIENNNNSLVTLTITYFLSGGGTKTVSGIPVPANSRYTRLVNSDLPSGTSASVQVTASGGSVLVERPMYFAF
jgi:hypothetical protein